MELGIGLPNAVPGTTGKQLTDFARAADEAGFSTLGTIDRIVYPNFEALLALSAAAAVTERIRLATSVMLGPLRMNAALVGKQLLTLDALAGGGRAVLGIGIGGREDDYEISKLEMSKRGQWLDDALTEIRLIWDGKGELESKVGPRLQGGGPSLIVGGYVKASFDRAARFADGWIQGGSGPDQFEEDAAAVDRAWKEAGRDGKPRKMALGYFSLGEHACHLRDLEREGYRVRLERMLAEDRPVLEGFDGAAVAARRDYRSQDGRAAARAFAAERAALVARLARLPPEAFARTAVFEGRAIMLCDLVAMIVEHDRGHREEIEALAREAGPWK
jgi:alkanesulfonate monooxygenase SsuD/methylene tetrahydromethanopterin reductase-like flavin-dependent oxidoreductase (luciferase family)